MRHLDLFSGIGGFALGLECAGFETVAFCEIEEYPRKVLNKHWPDVPIYEDVRDVTKDRLESDGITDIGIITGGFPCQDISTAGNKVGISGARSGLWKELCRAIGDIRPRYAIVENVTALLNRGMDVVCGDLAGIGYSCEWTVIGASDLGSPHGRHRCWIICYPDNEGEPGGTLNDEAQVMPQLSKGKSANAERRKQPLGRVLEGIGRHGQQFARDIYWEREDSPLGMGVDDGIPHRMDRLRGLGNAVVPQIPELIGRAIMEVEHDS